MIELCFLFNGISTLSGYLMPNAPLCFFNGQSWYNLNHRWEDKEVHTFSMGICPKVNVIARPEFDLAKYNSAF